MPLHRSVLSPPEVGSVSSQLVAPPVVRAAAEGNPSTSCAVSFAAPPSVMLPSAEETENCMLRSIGRSVSPVANVITQLLVAPPAQATSTPSSATGVDDPRLEAVQ